MSNEACYGASTKVKTDDGRIIDRVQFDHEQAIAAATADLRAMKIRAEKRAEAAEDRVAQLQKLIDSQAESRTK